MPVTKKVARKKTARKKNTTEISRKVVRLVGLDVSLTSTGVAYKLGDEYSVYRIEAAKLRGAQRLAYIESEIVKALRAAAPQMVMLEGYSFGSKFGREQMGEVGGIVRLACWREGCDVTIVPPTTLKSAMIGRAGKSATKKTMQLALLEKFGLGTDQDDEADALALLILGEMSYLGQNLHDLVDLTSVNECEILRGRRLFPGTNS